ncbi:MAG: class F sortase [bacterium]|nr:class F sortase [bacterium]
MISNHKIRRSLLIAILTGTAAIFIVAVYFFTHNNGYEPAVEPNISTEQPAISENKSNNASLPIRLKIPRIKVDASVEYTGLTASGDMDVPTNSIDVGWYKLGARPGNNGSAVIAGHLVGQKGEPAVFADLSKLEKGDTMSITDDKGDTISFIVRETRSYGLQERPSEVFDTNDDTAHLNLITCSGSWDLANSSYVERLVVFADRTD